MPRHSTYLLRSPENARRLITAIERLESGAGEHRLVYKLEPGQPHYYRLRGPRLLTEYDNSQRGGNHIHSVWRDPAGDFGRDVLALHYATSH